MPLFRSFGSSTSLVNLGQVSEGRDNNLNLLRFLLATAVIAYHCEPLLGNSARNSLPFLNTVFRGCGAFAVPFFFAISGFLITRSWIRRPQFADYIRHRVLRIYPAFLAAFAFCGLVVGPLAVEVPSEYWTHFHWLKFGIYGFLLPADVVGPDMKMVFPHLAYSSLINGSFWTLRYEFGCYLLVAFVGLLGLYSRPRLVLGLFVFLLIIRVFASIPNREWPWLGNLERWSHLGVYFASGSVFYLWRKSIFLTPQFFVLGLFGIVTAYFFEPVTELFLVTCGVYILFYLAFHPRLPFHNFAHQQDYSYGLYLYAFPCQQLLIYYFPKTFNSVSLFVVAFGMALSCALVSWHSLEKRFLHLKKPLN